MMTKAKYKKLQLQAFSIEIGGGMCGGLNRLGACLDEENNLVTVYKSRKSMWHLKPQAECYAVDSSLLDEIKQIIIDEKLYNAPKVPLSKMQALDADSTTYRACFSEGEFFSYSSNQALSSKIYDASGKIEALIEKYCVGAKAYPTVYAEEEEEYVSWREQEGITVDCSNDSPFQINFNIYNGKDEDAVLTGDVTLSRMNGDEAVYTRTLIENHSVEVYAAGEDSISVALPPDSYPEEGTYKMAYAGYETVFEMKIYKAE